MGTVIGALLGGVVVVFDTRRRTKQIKEGKKTLADFTPEDRLFLAMIGGIGFAVTMFGFAWSAHYK